MATTHSCPLCKRRIGVLIADIQSPSEYSQFLPNGKYLYTHFSSHRKAMLDCFIQLRNRYTMDLVPLPLLWGRSDSWTDQKALPGKGVDPARTGRIHGCDGSSVDALAWSWYWLLRLFILWSISALWYKERICSRKSHRGARRLCEYFSSRNRVIHSMQCSELSSGVWHKEIDWSIWWYDHILSSVSCRYPVEWMTHP